MKGTPLFFLFAIPSIGLAAIDFEKEILPIFEKSCVGCHKAPYEENGRLKKPKAGLRFDAAWALLTGGDNGKVLAPGDAENSELYWRTTLPEDDDDFMPPKGEKWTDSDKKLVAKWINEGADFGGWEGNLEGKPTITARAEAHISWFQTHYESLAKDLKEAPPQAIESAEAVGARVLPLA
ncbi:MAG: c-type cytochrome domain-containing protein, partial [Verrucomicrobiota bacterium]